MALTFTLTRESGTFNVGFGGVAIRVQNICHSAGDNVMSGVFSAKTSGNGKFAPPDNPSSRVSTFEWVVKGVQATACDWQNFEFAYYPEQAGTHVITVTGIPTVKTVSATGCVEYPRVASLGMSRTVSIPVDARFCPSLVAQFGSTPSEGYAPLSVSFNNITTNSSRMSFLWDFGDGTTSTQASPTHTFQNAGTYRVKLTATGSTADGCGSTTSYGYKTIVAMRQGVPECNTGTTKCQSNILYTCGTDYKYYPTGTCGAPPQPVVCVEDTIRCTDGIKYVCVDNHWKTEGYCAAPTIPVIPPTAAECTENDTKCTAGVAYKCVGGKWTQTGVCSTDQPQDPYKPTDEGSTSDDPLGTAFSKVMEFVKNPLVIAGVAALAVGGGYLMFKKRDRYDEL